MKKPVATLLFVALIVALLPALVAAADGEATMTGEIVDMACYISHGDHGHGAGHADCAKKCVKAGQPLGLLTDDGDLYVLFADHQDSTAFEKAKDHAGSMVQVTGAVSEKGGVKGITVRTVEPV